MGLIKTALRKPITILVIVAGVFFFGINAVRNIKIDIFPDLNLPVIYISHPFGGYTPNQMEGYFGKQYVNLLLYVGGVKSIDTRNIQGLTLIKLSFYEGTNMAQAAAEVTAFANRAQAIFPPGTQPPFIIRFDASTLPVGQLVLSSPTLNNNQLLNLANVYIRSAFTSIPGLISPAPFGGSTRTVVIKVDPQLLRAHNLTADQIVQAIRENNQPSPAGNVRIGNLNYMTPSNTSIKLVSDFEQIPCLKEVYKTCFLKTWLPWRMEPISPAVLHWSMVRGPYTCLSPNRPKRLRGKWCNLLKKPFPGFKALCRKTLPFHTSSINLFM